MVHLKSLGLPQLSRDSLGRKAIAAMRKENVMRCLTIVTIFITFSFISCEDKSTQPGQTTTYSQMLFERLGGGNLIFTASATSSKDTFQVTVTQKAFRDTSIQRTLVRNSNTTGMLDTLVAAFNGRIQVTGSFKQDTAQIVGTWTYVYMINGDIKTEVTNTTLRNTLLQLESIVKATL